MMTEAGVQAIMPDCPATSTCRSDPGTEKRVFILTNYGNQPHTITLPHAMTDVLAGGTVSTVTLDQYGVAVLH